MREAGVRKMIWIAGAATALGLVWAGAAQAQCGGLIEAGCLQSLGAGSTPLPDSDCGKQLNDYRQCLAGAATAAGGPAGGASGGGAGCSEARAQSLWVDAKAASDCVSYQGFRDACPNTPEARFALSAMTRLGCGGAGASARPAGAEAAARAAKEEQALHREIQTELKRLGDYQSAVDGVWGGGSETALKAFQRRVGLTPDGAPSAAALVSLRAAEPPSRARRPGELFRDCGACPQMAAIPGGSFTMGSPGGEKDRDADEGPQRRVTIRPFALGRDAVTVAEFRGFARATGREMRRCWTLKTPGGTSFGYVETASWENPNFPQDGDHPALCVSYDDALAFIDWLNGQVSGAPYRLPSEAEQEYALRADHPNAAFPWGGGEPDGCRVANSADQTAKGRFPNWTVSSCHDGHVFTAPIAAFASNGFGVRQLSGNVWEWSGDCWNDSYAGAPTDGSAWRSGNCARGVVRGGAWDGFPWRLRSADRVWYERSDRQAFVGFRVARDLEAR